MLKKFFTIFSLFFIAVAFIAGCSDSVGGLLINNGGNYIKALPEKYLYRLSDDPFKAEHVREVEHYFEGRKETIYFNDKNLKITITEDPTFHEEPTPITVGIDDAFIFGTKGRYIVGIIYLGMEDSYSIQVVAPEEYPGWTGGETTIKWEWEN
jgi:hypothetical protein